MEKYVPINGWTKERMIEQVKKYNKGPRAVAGADKYGACEYLTKDGNRCAVGCFIPDGHSGLMHEGAVFTLLEEFPSLTKEMPLQKFALNILQGVHDNTGPNDVSNAQQNIIKWIEENVA